MTRDRSRNVEIDLYILSRRQLEVVFVLSLELFERRCPSPSNFFHHLLHQQSPNCPSPSIRNSLEHPSLKSSIFPFISTSTSRYPSTPPSRRGNSPDLSVSTWISFPDCKHVCPFRYPFRFEFCLFWRNSTRRKEGDGRLSIRMGTTARRRDWRSRS